MCHAQAFRCDPPASDSTITTDRPSFTNASTTVPCRSLQIESGLLESSERQVRGFEVPEAALRFGFTNSSELRFAAPIYYQTYSTGTGVATGLGDIALGIKQELSATKRGFNLAVIASLSLPTGAKAVSSHGYDPTVQAPWSQKLSKNWTANGMFATSWQTQGHQRYVTGQASTYFDRQITERIDAYAEYSGSFPQQGSPQHYLTLGGNYKPTPHQQIDLRAGFGLSEAATDHFFGIGYSIRLGR